MRAHKYRGFDPDKKQWVCGGVWENSKECTFIMLHNGFAVMVDPESVGQFTGKTDSNGVDIFEGDKLRIHIYEGCDESDCDEVEIRFCSAGHMNTLGFHAFKNNEIWDFYGGIPKIDEYSPAIVIGNIYESKAR